MQCLYYKVIIKYAYCAYTRGKNVDDREKRVLFFSKTSINLWIAFIDEMIFKLCFFLTNTIPWTMKTNSQSKICKQITFSNFSCMFPNPNNFFQFEFSLEFQKFFWITRRIYSNSEKSEKCLVTECLFNLFLEVSQI